jgi:hypothetical protein
MELKLQKFRISLVLNSFFFPLTSSEVFDSMKARGFEIPTPQGSLLTGPRVYISGVIARKQGVLVDIDGSRNLVGVEGLEIPATLSVFSEMANVLIDDFFVDFHRELSYVELIAHYLIKSDSNPSEVIQNAIELRFRDQFRRILNIETSDYHFSITPRGVLPSSREWFEISISPKLTMPTRAYWVEAIYRNGNPDLVTTFASNLNSTISDIINTIEERNRPGEQG